MKSFSIKTLTMLLLIVCSSFKNTNTTDKKTICNAQWIAFDLLEDSMKVVPAVHGSGDELGDKCLKRSVVPMFRKVFIEPENIKR